MGRARAMWDAAAHPRGPNGRFVKAGSGSSAPGSHILGTLARNAATQPAMPSSRGTAAQRLAAAASNRATTGAAAAMFARGAGRGRLHATLSHPAPAGPVARPASAKPGAVKADVHDAIRRLAGTSGGYVALSRLRDDLGDRHSRAAVDRALTELDDAGRVNLEPEPNQKILRPIDRAAALRLGGEDRHLVAITPERSPRVPATPGTGRDRTEAAIREAHAQLSRMPGDWVPLAELRDRLPTGLSRKEIDAALESLAQQPGVHLIPWDNRKALTARDRAAALRFGGDDNHALRIEGVSPRHQSLSPQPGGGYRVGTISRDEAARVMHGPTGRPASGSARSKLRSAPASPNARPAFAPGAASRLSNITTPAEAVIRLRAMTRRDDGHALLAKATKADLIAILEQAQVPYRTGTKERLRTDLVEALIGRRQDHEAIMRSGRSI